MISINPYKFVEGLYEDETMELYHGRKQVSFYYLYSLFRKLII
jgi:hypothetical protein